MLPELEMIKKIYDFARQLFPDAAAEWIGNNRVELDRLMKQERIGAANVEVQDAVGLTGTGSAGIWMKKGRLLQQWNRVL